MGEVSGDYLYIIQEREDVRANRNIYKFGRTSQTPKKRFNNYPKDSRVWLIIIMNNIVDSETNLKRLFKQKFKQRSDRGDEYYEVDDVQDMMNLVWQYHQEHFDNIYMPKVFDADKHFKEIMIKLLNEDSQENMVYFRMADIDRADFVCYLLEYNWKHDIKRQIIMMNKNDYESFLKNIEDNASVSKQIEENNDSDVAVIGEEIEPLRPLPTKPTKPKIVVKSKSSSSMNDKFPVSVEQIGDVFCKYAVSHKLKTEGLGARIYVRYNEEDKFTMNVKKVDLFNNTDNKTVASIFDLSTISKNNDKNDITKLLLSKTKFDKLKKVYNSECNDYILTINSLTKKKFKPKDSNRWVKYLIVEFSRQK